MSFDIRLPNVNANTDAGRLQQMQSYMYQLVEQLNWALNNIDTAGGGSSQYLTSKQGAKELAGQTDAKASFDELKALIIKSADIVNAYYDIFTARLEGLYVASSDFGNYVQSTNQTIQVTSERVDMNYENIEGLQSDLENFGTMILETNAYIHTGYIYDREVEEGISIPIYGIEVGQTSEVDGETVFDKFARFTADGIYFYNPNQDIPIAYMSTETNKLYITNAEFTSSLKLGGFTLSTENGLKLRWGG